MVIGICVVAECDRAEQARHMCNMHYQRWWKHGDPNTGRRPRGTCSIDGCNRANCARGWCQKHYERWKRNGDPIFVDDRRTDPIERIRARIAVIDGCWIFGGTRNGGGYGRIKRGREGFMTHRVMYEAFKGAIPLGYEIDHLCSNPPCVNPAHLEAVTPKENTRRSRERGRRP